MLKSGGDAGPRALVAPPPPPEIASRAALPWTTEGPRATPPPRHPLLILAEPDSGGEAPRLLRGRLRNLRTGLVGDRRPAARGAHAVGGSSAWRGVTVVVGATGGCGTSTLALDVGWVAGRAGRGPGGSACLLVDADLQHPALDLMLGAATLDDDLWPSARLDHLLLRLPELASGALDLEQLLWAAPSEPMKALLSPSRAARVEAGPEHLDYLFRYQLAPRFQCIVVDGGCPGTELAPALRFWLGVADWLLVCTRATDRSIRSCLDLLSSASSVPGERRGGVVLALETRERADRVWARLEPTGCALWERPWVPRQALLAAQSHRPLAAVDRGTASSVAALLEGLAAVPGARHG